MLVIWLSSITSPAQIGQVKTKGYTEDIVNPKNTAPRQQASSIWPAQTTTRETIPLQKMPSIRIFSFLVLVPGAKASKNLNIVSNTQKRLGNLVAPALSVTEVSTANEGIHPPNDVSTPTQIKIKRHKQISIFVDIDRALRAGDVLCQGIKPHCSGDFIFRSNGIRRNINPPKTKQALSSKIQTKIGERIPPTPKAPCPISIQYQASSGGLISRKHTFSTTSKTQQPVLAKNIHVPNQNELCVRVNTQVKTVMIEVPAINRV